MSNKKYFSKINARKKALLEFKKRLTKVLGEEIFEIKLFGSAAKGNFKKDSDLDVLIVLKSLSKKKKDFILTLSTEILLKYGVDISPRIYSKKEYLKEKNLPSIFMQILEKEAIPL